MRIPTKIKKNNIKTSLFLVFCLVFLITCSDDSVPPSTKIPEETNANFFFDIKQTSYWEMQNSNGDKAHFNVLSPDSISIATRFWDTIGYNRNTVLATPIQFTYSENGIKRWRYFALIEEEDGFILAGRRHPLLAEYDLKDFYVYLFKIPNLQPEDTAIETDSIIQQVGSSQWKRDYTAKWTNSDSISIENKQHSIWNVKYNAYDQFHTPQNYNNEFAFMENIGFYRYMGYTLITEQ